MDPVIINSQNDLVSFKIYGALEADKKRGCVAVKVSLPSKILYGEDWERFTKAFSMASLIKLKGEPKFESFLAADFDY